MNPIKLFFGFTGRISRRWLWLGLIAISVINYALLYVIKPEMFAFTDPDDLEALKKLLAPDWRVTLSSLVLLVPVTAIIVKRFNDRNRPFWLGFVIMGIYAVLTLMPHFGWNYAEWMMTISQTPADIGAEFWIFIATVAVLSLLGLWITIDLGFLRGTKGPNRYGPDPKEKAA